MRSHSMIIAAVAACMLAVASATPVPATWQHLGAVEADRRVPLLIAVAHTASQEELASQCTDVSDPSSPSYGHHMTREQVSKLLGSDANTNTVVEFLRDGGVADADITVGGTGDFVHVHAPAAILESTFGVSFDLYKVPVDASGSSPARHAYLARSLTAPTLPANVDAAIDLVVGINNFATAPARSSPASRAIAASKATGVDVATNAIEAAASRLRGAADAPQPPEAMLAVVAEAFYLYFLPSSTPDVTYELNLVIDGTTSQTVPFTMADTTQVNLLGSEMTAFNTTQYIKLYSAYNYTLTAVSSTGMKSAPLGLPMQWDTIPSSWKGVVASPTNSPASYASFYGLPPKSMAAGATQSVAEFSGQYYSPSDLTMYMNQFDITGEPSVTLVGQNDASNPGIEAQMDIELIVGVAQGVPSTFWEVSPSNKFSDGWMLEWASQMSDSSSPPLVTSISYGIAESNPQFSSQYITRTQSEFMKLCMRGLTVMVASGDAGATSNGHGGGACQLEPAFPGSSSWITSVSATAQSSVAPARASGGVGEAAISIATGQFWTTGGGFSILESNRRPSYQAKAVEAYIASATMPDGYNKTGRAYPDVSSIGTNYWMTISGATSGIGSGTSSASPTFAGIVTRLNQARLAAGKPSVGFLNPLLYSLAESNPEVFYDVVVGSNYCGEYVCCPGVGFDTATGWDPVTGLGSVGDYDKLESLVLAAA